MILQEYPKVNSPLEVRFFVRLRTAMNTSFTLPKQELNTILESFLRNISDTFGVEFTGNIHNIHQLKMAEYIFLNGIYVPPHELISKILIPQLLPERFKPTVELCLIERR